MTETAAAYTLFELPKSVPAHPAQYTDALLTTFARMLRGSRRILDPFGGKGGVFALEHWLPGTQIAALEIEPEWAAADPRITVGNALHMLWEDGYFDAICTSPAYGSRMADKLLRDPGKTKTYASDLGRELHPENGAGLQWGRAYRELHVGVWAEAWRVLCPGGRFVLNMKDHIRNGQRQHVTDWHIEALTRQGFELQEQAQIVCPGMRWGANAAARVPYESVILFTRGA